MAKGCKELPDELWELIISHLSNDTNFEPLSLVCKQLYKLSNQLCPKLIVTHVLISTHNINNFALLINKRFPNINSIQFNNSGFDIEDLVFRISNCCELNKLNEIDLCYVDRMPFKGLGNFKGIRVLKCSRARVLRDNELVRIGKLLPLLEELDVSYPRNEDDGGGGTEVAITDYGVRVLSTSVRNLRRINLSGNRFVSGESLVCLSENCEFLEGVDVVDCKLITVKGFLFLLRNSVRLKEVSASGIYTRNGDVGLDDMDCIEGRLDSLDLRNSTISDEFMQMLVDVCVDLRKLSLTKCTCFVVSSLALLLGRCNRLQHLTLWRVRFYTDEPIIQLSPYLRNLVSLQLSSSLRDGFTLRTFHEVVKCSPSLDFVQMQCTIWRMTELHLDSLKYATIRSLNLSRSYGIPDEVINGIVSACPNLETLDVSFTTITEKSLSEILDTCHHQIKILRIDYCRIKYIGQGLELPKLEVLNAACSSINDEGLAQIAIRCPRLEKLEISNCHRLTDRGVKEIVGTCKRLKEISFYGCENVDHINMIPWMNSTRPSLVKLVPPSNIYRSDSEDIFFL